MFDEVTIYQFSHQVMDLGAFWVQTVVDITALHVSNRNLYGCGKRAYKKKTCFGASLAPFVLVNSSPIVTSMSSNEMSCSCLSSR